MFLSSLPSLRCTCSSILASPQHTFEADTDAQDTSSGLNSRLRNNTPRLQAAVLSLVNSRNNDVAFWESFAPPRLQRAVSPLTGF